MPVAQRRNMFALAVYGLLLIGVMLDAAAPLRAQSIPSGLRSAVYYHAPFLIAEVKKYSAHVPRRVDHILATDFDGNRYGPDNPSDAEVMMVSNPVATVYFAAAETGTTSDVGYYFVTYAWYHASDEGFHTHYLGYPVDDDGHDHDMEGAFFVIKKSPYLPYGGLVTVATQAHGALIPYRNANPIVDPGIPAGTDTYAGFTEFWTDPALGSQRSVVAIRGADHGSYMAQDCGHYPMLDGGYGMWRGSYEELGGWYTCYHDDSDLMLYRPALEGQSSFSALNMDVRTGVATYQLLELATTSLWEDRGIYNQMLGGHWLTLGDGGGYAISSFHANNLVEDSQPLWNWVGGSGGCPANRCYYSFGHDGTPDFDSPKNWPTSQPGTLITMPSTEASLRFPALPQLDQRQCYNPYVSPRPDCSTAPPLQLSIMGPNYVTQGFSNAWQAFVSGGTAPYTYTWSGALSGSSQTLVGSIYDIPSDDLFLTVTDALGLVIYGSVSITVCANQTPC